MSGVVFQHRERKKEGGKEREREREFVLSLKHALDKFLRELFQCNEREGERLLFYSYFCAHLLTLS